MSTSPIATNGFTQATTLQPQPSSTQLAIEYPKAPQGIRHTLEQPSLDDISKGLSMDPEKVLQDSEQRFPGIDRKILQGKGSVQSSNGIFQLRNLNSSPVTGTVPGHPDCIMLNLGTPENPKPALLPTKGVAGKDATEQAQNIQALIQEGQALFSQIQKGPRMPPHTKKNLNALMWHLQALSSAKAGQSAGLPGQLQLFESGAITIADKGNKVGNWLQGFNTYPRSSSHLSDFQKAPGCSPRGLDIRGQETPNARKTLLMQQLPTSPDGQEGTLKSDTPLLFLKMESHGCRGLFSVGGTGNEGEKTGFGHAIKRFFANFADMLGHGFSFLATRGSSKNGAGNKERVDPGLLAPYKTAIAQLKLLVETAQKTQLGTEGNDKKLSSAQQMLAEDAAAKLEAANFAGKTGGVHEMLSQLNACIQSIKEKIAQDPSLKGPANEILGELQKARTNLLALCGDHPEIRFGREIILTPEEMQIPHCDVIQWNTIDISSPQSFSGQGVRPKAHCQADLAGLSYQLSSPKELALGIKQFNKDANRGFHTDLDMPGGKSPEGLIGPEYASNASQRIHDFCSLHEAPRNVAALSAAIKALCHQGALGPGVVSLVDHALGNHGVILTPGDCTTRFTVSKDQDGPEGQHIYRLHMTAHKEVQKEVQKEDMGMPISSIDTNAPPIYSQPGSKIDLEQELLLSYDPQKQSFSIAYAPGGEPSFSYDIKT
jgi:hypothetical protein